MSVAEQTAGQTLPAPALERFAAELFAALGMHEGNARLCAREIVLTNLWGIDSHGLLRLPVYAGRLAGGVVHANPRVTIESGRGALQRMDGDNGMGFIVGHEAMAHAIRLAREYGIGAVAVRNSNHFGAAGLYARVAAEAGMLGLAMTNVRPNLIAPGGAAPIAGNNPLAFSAPRRGGVPFLLDISMSAVAGGKLLHAIASGEPIPEGWATDREGRPTTDPRTGFEGFLMPVGGHKGLGLSEMVDILSGVLAGGAFQFAVESMYDRPDLPSQTGHMMIALDPEAMGGREAFLDRMDAFAAAVHAAPMRTGTGRLPGEIEHETRTHRLNAGIPLPATLVADLAALGATYGCTLPAPVP